MQRLRKGNKAAVTVCAEANALPTGDQLHYGFHFIERNYVLWRNVRRFEYLIRKRAQAAAAAAEEETLVFKQLQAYPRVAFVRSGGQGIGRGYRVVNARHEQHGVSIYRVILIFGLLRWAVAEENIYRVVRKHGFKPRYGILYKAELHMWVFFRKCGYQRRYQAGRAEILKAHSQPPADVFNNAGNFGIEFLFKAYHLLRLGNV